MGRFITFLRGVEKGVRAAPVAVLGTVDTCSVVSEVATPADLYVAPGTCIDAEEGGIEVAEPRSFLDEVFAAGLPLLFRRTVPSVGCNAQGR